MLLKSQRALMGVIRVLKAFVSGIFSINYPSKVIVDRSSMNCDNVYTLVLGTYILLKERLYFSCLSQLNFRTCFLLS